MTTFCERREVSKELPGATVLDVGKLPVVGEDGKYELVPQESISAGYFYITCTPTNADLSGTMDKTPDEIKEAYLAGKEIRVLVPQSESRFVEVIPESIVKFLEGGEIDSVCVAATFVYHAENDAWLLVQAATSVDSSTYGTTIFSLTLV